MPASAGPGTRCEVRERYADGSPRSVVYFDGDILIAFGDYDTVGRESIRTLRAPPEPFERAAKDTPAGNGPLRTRVQVFTGDMLVAEYTHINDVWNGPARFLNEGGVVFLELNYLNGRLDGLQKIHAPDGSIESVWECRDGVTLGSIDPVTAGSLP